MAEKTDKKAPAPKAKKPSKSLITKAKKYKDGKNCPRCGEGFRLAEHKDRRSCGKCNYTEKK